jgi:hypothetical protein
LARRQTVRSRLHEEPVDIEAIVLRQRGQSGDGI